MATLNLQQGQRAPVQAKPQMPSAAAVVGEAVGLARTGAPQVIFAVPAAWACRPALRARKLILAGEVVEEVEAPPLVLVPMTSVGLADF